MLGYSVPMPYSYDTEYHIWKVSYSHEEQQKTRYTLFPPPKRDYSHLDLIEELGEHKLQNLQINTPCYCSMDVAGINSPVMYSAWTQAQQ